MSESPHDQGGEEEGDDAVVARAMRISLIVFAAIGLVVAGVVYWLTREDEEEVVEAPQVQELDVREVKAAIPEVPFADITESAGLRFVHENGAAGEKLLPETMGAGCAFLDYDNDGDPDILFVNGARWPWDQRGANPEATLRLYRNEDGARFTDVTRELGLDVAIYGMGVAVGDYDNDGKVDVFVSAVGPDRLFRNLGDRFVDVTTEAGVAGADDAWGTSCGFFDYDNDGLLDLFVCNYVKWSREIDLAQDFRLTGIGRAYGRPTNFEGAFCSLFRNTGGGGFVDVSEPANIRVKNHLTGVPMAKALGLAPVDLDRDGWIDLVVANDTVQNFVFHNQAGKQFEEVGALAGVAFDSNGGARGAMGIDVAPLWRDDGAVFAIGIGNFANEMTALYVAADDPMRFSDAAIATGLGPVTRSSLTFGLFFFDYDLDGRLDLFAANGHLEEDINKVQESQYYAQPPQLFWNAGPDARTQFAQVGEPQVGSALLAPLVGRGSAFADIDGDGDLDVLITASGGAPRLMRNDLQADPSRGWMRLKLTGTRSNRDAIGAWVELTIGDRVIRRQVMPTRSYLSQVELPLTFAVAAGEQVTEAAIEWPSGSRQKLELPEVNRVYTITETDSAAP